MPRKRIIEDEQRHSLGRFSMRLDLQEMVMEAETITGKSRHRIVEDGVIKELQLLTPEVLIRHIDGELKRLQNWKDELLNSVEQMANDNVLKAAADLRKIRTDADRKRTKFSEASLLMGFEKISRDRRIPVTDLISMWETVDHEEDSVATDNKLRTEMVPQMMIMYLQRTEA